MLPRSSPCALLVLAILAGLAWDAPSARAQAVDLPFPVLEFETKSEFSRIRVYKTRNSMRTLIFVRDNGDEALESQVDLEKPHELHIPYVQFMFMNYLIRPKPEKVLIVGLGGGSMVHFIRRHDPEVQIDAIEIDPAVVEIAKKYFAVRAEDKVKLLTEDGLKYLEGTEAKYDVIYMDAFLKPSADTDKTGAPLKSRTLAFYEKVQTRLNPSGLVVFNLNPHKDLDDDIATIRKGFKQAYVFRLAKAQGTVVVASMAVEREKPAALQKVAQELDKRFGANFSFQRHLKNLER